MGLWNFIWLAAGNSHIPYFTTISIYSYFGTQIYGIIRSHQGNLLSLESLFGSLFESLLKRLYNSLQERAMMERTALEKAYFE